jgi:hypothetical protein
MSKNNGTHIVCCVRVIVYTPEERRGGIAARVRSEYDGTSRVLRYEGASIVYEACNEEQRSRPRIRLD